MEEPDESRPDGAGNRTALLLLNPNARRGSEPIDDALKLLRDSGIRLIEPHPPRPHQTHTTHTPKSKHTDHTNQYTQQTPHKHPTTTTHIHTQNTTTFNLLHTTTPTPLIGVVDTLPLGRQCTVIYSNVCIICAPLVHIWGTKPTLTIAILHWFWSSLL